MVSEGRRRFLTTVTGLGVAGLSGCSSLTGSPETEQSESDSAGPTDRGSDDQSTSVLTDGTDVTGQTTGESESAPESGSESDSPFVKLVPDDGDAGDRFGSVIAASGDTVVVSAVADEDPNGTNSGSAYVFQWADGSWTQGAKLYEPEDMVRHPSGDLFGASVSLSETSLVVGAPFYSVVPAENEQGVTALDGGALYVFDRSEWAVSERVIAEDESEDDRFGSAVSVSGSTMLVGAPGKDDRRRTNTVDFEPGGVYVFERSDGEWTESAQLAVEDDSIYQLGRRVELAGDRAFVGAGHETSARSNPGALFAFVRSGDSWEREGALTPDGSDPGREFGRDISVSGDTALVGAEGVVHVFSRSGGSWAHETEITPGAGANSNGEFGAAVELADDRAVVGDPSGATNGEEAGAVYEFERDGGEWRKRRRHLAPDGDAEDQFGGAVAVDTGLLAVGAHADEDPNRELSGSAYVAGRETTASEATETPGSPTPAETPASAAEMTWPTYQYDAVNSGATDATVSVEGNEKWRFDLLSSLEGSPVVGGGTVYAGTESGVLYALSPDDGSIEWEYQESDSIDRGRKFPTVAGDTVYVSSRSVVALNADDGSEQWRGDVGSRAAPTVVDGAVYISNAQGVAGLDADDGTTRWEFETEGYGSGSPAVDDETVYVGDSDGIVYALDASDGSEQWRFRTGSDIDAPPAVVDGGVYVTAMNGSVYALSATDGRKRWQNEVGYEIRSSPAVVDGSVYVTAAAAIYSLTADSGDVEWKSRGGSDDSSPVVADGTLFTGSIHGLCALDVTDGSEYWCFSPDRDVSSVPAVGEDTVYFASNVDQLYALE